MEKSHKNPKWMRLGLFSFPTDSSAVTIKLVKTLQMFKVAFKKTINRGKSLQLNKTKEIAIKDNDKGKQIISYRL